MFGANKATGGAITGLGTGTSDSILGRLSNGEHVITAAEVQAAGGQGAIYGMRAMIRAGRTPKFAAGGAVGVATISGGNNLAVIGQLVTALRANTAVVTQTTAQARFDKYQERPPTGHRSLTSPASANRSPNSPATSAAAARTD